MRPRAPAAAGPLLVLLAAFGCGGEEEPGRVAVPGHPGATKSAASVRAERRAYDGAPPVIPHGPIGSCLACHGGGGLSVPGLGFAPPNPHLATSVHVGSFARCNQCHVHAHTEEVFVESTFLGLPQDLEPGPRAYEGAPPGIPHPLLLRRDCQACHAGPAAREDVRCTHPERTRCLQCHVPRRTDEAFRRP